MESEEFMELPVNQLMDIISSDELNVRSEEQVFSAVMAWVKYNVTERRPYLAQVSYVIVWLGFFAVCIFICCVCFWIMNALNGLKKSCMEDLHEDSFFKGPRSWGLSFFHFQVLEHVRLPLLSPKFLVGTVGSDLLIKSDEVSAVFWFFSFATAIDYLEWYVYFATDWFIWKTMKS